LLELVEKCRHYSDPGQNPGVFHNIGLVFANKWVFSILLVYFVCNMGPNNSKYGLYGASARISKVQGYQGFSRKRAVSSFVPKRAICIVQGKMDRISLLFGSIKCFPVCFDTFKTEVL
jgi:hypothetical protein